MIRPFLALLVLLLVVETAAYGQSVAQPNQLIKPETLNSTPKTDTNQDHVLAARAIAALKRLESDVPVYHSVGEFESTGKLARVSFATFQNDLQEVSAEVETILSRLPESRMRTEISNALRSYQDGAYRWAKIYQPRVVNVSALIFTNATRTPSDAAYLATIPYTVVINWRQASKYLQSAERVMNEKEISISLNQKLQ